MSRKAALGIFVKYPTPGMVKTRIAAAIGNEAAALFYKRMADTVIMNSRSLNAEYEQAIFFEPAENKQPFIQWLGQRIFIAQQGEELGSRMANAIKELLVIADRAIIIGTDIPDISSYIISAAFGQLDTCDIVLGPARDGGYYLIGMKELHKEIFEDIEWSRPDVLSKTIEKIEASGLTYVLVTELSDVDTIEDYERYNIVR